jgi:hypothetical protein
VTFIDEETCNKFRSVPCQLTTLIGESRGESFSVKIMNISMNTWTGIRSQLEATRYIIKDGVKYDSADNIITDWAAFSALPKRRDQFFGSKADITVTTIEELKDVGLVLQSGSQMTDFLVEAGTMIHFHSKPDGRLPDGVKVISGPYIGKPRVPTRSVDVWMYDPIVMMMVQLVVQVYGMEGNLLKEVNDFVEYVNTTDQITD